VLKMGSKSVLADLTPRGLEVVGLRTGDRVALEGEQKPSEIKVSKLERNGELCNRS
jgi:transcription elongation GreA/GreB family factor